MQLILLCGGSGKRLWPLSNGVRSKQFLQLLDSENGTKESMFQRVLRQIYSSGINAEINIATSHSQVDSISSQSFGNISLIEEPYRRDTFPAIALAVEFLFFKKGCADDEIVVVMPCDVYTTSGYFDVIKEMAEVVKKRTFDMVLMGIEPSEPSSKLGYIVPNKQNLTDVVLFVEKPDKAYAENLIEKGALWNGGVFAFKLGYIRNLIANYIQSVSFEDVIAKFDSLPQISFDYEVVEKTQSIGFVKYSGMWKDLGTWESLCPELPKNTIGHVIDKNNLNTTIINELSIPIICSGCSNIIIAASPDGIIVADKECAVTIKEAVNEVNHRPMYEERRWGTYKVLDSMTFDDGSSVLTKTLTLKPGASISYQRHGHREEVWTIVDGSGEVVIGTNRRNISSGDVIVIPIGEMHALRAITKLTLVEVQRGSQLVEEDIERFDYEW